MNTKSKLTSVMETGDHFKNGASTKSQMSRGNVNQIIIMKKMYFFIVLAAMIMPVKVFGQDARWGIKGGINFSQERSSEESTDTRVGFHIGGFMEKPIGRGCDIQLGLLYSMQGGKSKAYDWTDKLDYISVPVMFKIYINKERRKFSIDLGPQFGYMIYAKNTGVFDFADDAFNKFELGVGVGASYKVADNFDLVLRLTGGLTKIFKDSDEKNSGIQLGIGYRF